MCGIYGMVALKSAPLHAPELLEQMGRRLRHRGPDDRRVMTRPEAAMGTERLRIVDPGPQGAQPCTDPASRIWLSCNGEIYGAAALRRRYADYPYQSRTDVEPLVPLFLHKGPAGLAELDGMFAIAIWDTCERRLVLARDRAGEKPLFYTRMNGEVWFASEIQALLELPAASSELDPFGLVDFLELGYVLEPRTMFGHVRKVEAGTIVELTERGQQVHRYWNPGAVATEPRSELEAERHLAALLERAVQKQVVADVPVGVFTSGGVDSALLSTLARRAVDPEVLHTFTATFAEPSYDEARYAASVARVQGTKHVEVRVDERALGEAFTTVADRIAEPIADPAILPTYLLARTAREHVGIVLSGEGADELFGGYPTYLGHQLAPWFNSLPPVVRRTVRRLASLLPPSTTKVPLEFLLKRFVADADKGVLDRHLAWFATGLDQSVWNQTLEVAPRSLPIMDASADPLRQVMLFDYLTYLRDNLLVKVDRATMLVSLEARAPYLDRELATFALSLDPGLKVRGLQTKWLLKRVARTLLPRSIVRRRKRGLSVPIAQWINRGLKTEVDRLLAPERLRREGVLRERRVRQLLSEHRAGRANHARPLWTLLVYETWRERWLGD